MAVLLCTAKDSRAYALEPWADNVYVASEGACLMDADTGVVLYGKNEEAAYYPASITKVMTALLTIENCDNLSEQVTFSYEAVHIEEENSTIIGASEGDKLSVLDCLYSLLFQSANEVANALAEHVGAKHPELKQGGMSDRDVFVKMMNNKAAELGCTGTHFNNPSGLTDSEHYVTAHDMCRILAAAVKNSTFLEIESHTYWTHAPIKRYPDANDPWNTVYAKHSMLKRNSSRYYSGAIAGKTGYTMTAGNTLVTAARRNGMTLVTCVLNAHSNHYNDTARLLDFGFDNFISMLVNDYDDTDAVIASDFRIGGINLLNIKGIQSDPDARITVPKGAIYMDVSSELKTVTDADGTESAKLIYYYGDKVVGSAAMEFVNIDDGSALLEAAKTDPLIANALGIKTAKTDAGVAAAGNDAAQTAGGGADKVTAAGDMSAVAAGTAADGTGNTEPIAANTADSNAEPVQEATAAGGEGEAVSGTLASPDTAGISTASPDTSGTVSADTTSAPKQPATNIGASGSEDAANISAADASDRLAGDSNGTKTSIGSFIAGHLDAIKTVGIAACGVAALLAVIVFINTIRDRKRAESRARRRERRLRRSSDMSGSHQIHMDLEINNRAKRSRRKGH